MNAAFVGYLTGIFVMASLLPGAFLAYGLSSKKSWPTAIAAFIFIGVPLGQIKSGNIFEALVAAGFAALTWWWLARLYRDREERGTG